MMRPHSHKGAARAVAVIVVSFLGVLSAVWAAPRVSDAAAAWISIPAVRSAETTLSAGLPVAPRDAGEAGARARSSSGDPAGSSGSKAARASTIDPGMRFTMIGLTCRPPARRGAVVVRLRTSDDGVTWSRWYEVELEHAAEKGGPEKAFTEPIWTGAARLVQVTARGVGSSAVPARLRGVRLVAINTTEDADRGAVVLGAIRRAAVAIAGLHLTPEADAMTTKPRIVTRAGWGADESWRRGSPSFAPVKMAFIHHTDSGNNYTAAQAPAIVRAVYHYHTKSLHWSDIGYNFLIDRYGTIYEGRYGGITKGALGAQTLGFNTGSTGISVIGTFSSATPTSASVTSLERLLEWKLDVHHVDPQGTATLVCGYGQKYRTNQRVRFPAIAGHRDANYTDCPGGRLYRLLPAVRRVVGRTGQPKIYGFVVGEPAISPNSDGVKDETTLGFTVSEPADWSLEIRAAGGTVVWRLEGHGTKVAATWAGTDDYGNRLPDGTYTVRAEAVSARGTARPGTDTVRIDTVAPGVASIRATPDPFSPNGDSYRDVATLAFTPVESGSARTSVLDADGAVARRLTGWKAATAAARRVKWDGRVKKGGVFVTAPEGPVTLAVEVRDEAGNATTVQRQVGLDCTLGFAALSRSAFSPNGDGRHDAVTLRFRLTRAADVTATVDRDGQVARTLELGTLDAGRCSVAWDGAVTGGASATSGTYRLGLSARSVVGVTTLNQSVVVDLARPRVKTPDIVVVKRGAKARVPFTARDSDSPSVNVLVTATDAKGRTVARIKRGWVGAGKKHVVAWRPRARGIYTLSFRVYDRAGNRPSASVGTKLKVR